MSKLRNPWCYNEVLEFNSNGEPSEMMLGWQLRLEILERIAKLLASLHRKKLSYGTLTSRAIFISSVTEYGILAKDDYLIDGLDLDSNEPVDVNLRDNKQNLDNLAFGVVALQIATEKPLNRRLLPQLFKLLERRGLEIDYVTTNDIDDAEEVDENYAAKELKKERKYRTNSAESGRRKSAIGNMVGGVMHAFSKAQELVTGGKKEVTEPKNEEDEYALASIIKDEVYEYLGTHISGGKDIEKPKWMLNLEELIADCLTSVEESRPTASVIRTWLLEALMNFKRLAQKSNFKQEALLDDVDYLYEVINIHKVLRLCDKVGKDVFVLHSTDMKGFDDDLESLDSFMPPEEVGKLLTHEEHQVDEDKNEDYKLEKATTELLDEEGNQIRLNSVSILDAKTKRVFDNMAKQIQSEGEVLPSKKIGACFDRQERLKHEDVVNLLKRARKVLSEESNIIVVDAPVTVIGDIHGQYFDLRQIMRIIGKPRQTRHGVSFGMTRKRQKEILEKHGKSAADPNASFKEGSADDQGNTFLFLGDYVDRGAWSCEVLFYVLSLKVEYNHSVFLLRGNHECDAMGAQYGFRMECEFKYGREVYHRCLEVFKALPIACIINLPNRKRFLACHGGISENIRNLHDIAQVNRFREPGLEGTLCDIVWSDPVDNDVEQQGLEFERIEFMENPERGCGQKFGYFALEKFLKENKLAGIIRAHQAIEEGFHFHFQNHGTRDHLVATVFSAPNYLNECGNKGAVIVVHKTIEDRIRIQTARYHGRFTAEQLLYSEDVDRDEAVNYLEPICYTEVIQPEVAEVLESEDNNITNQITETCPYMPITLRDFFESTLDILDRFGDARMQIQTHQEATQQSKRGRTPEQQRNLESGTEKFKRALVKLRALYLFKRAGRKRALRRKYQETMRRKAMELNPMKEMHPQVAKEKALHATRKLEMIENDNSSVLTSQKTQLSIPYQTTLDFRKRSSVKKVLERRTLERFKFSSVSSSLSLDTFVGRSNGDLRNFFEQIKQTTTTSRETVQIEHIEEWKRLLANWFTSLTSRKVRATHFCRDIEDGIALCETVQHLISKSQHFTYIKPKPTGKLNSVEKRANLFAFFDACKSLGITSTFFMVDLKTDSIEYVLPCLVELADLAKKRKLFKGNLPNESFLYSGDTTNTDITIRGVTFDVKEQTMLQLLFLTIDRDDNGIIDFNELMQWADEEGLILEKEDAQLCISAIDYDGDTVIGLADFFQFAAKQKEIFQKEDNVNFQSEQTKSAVIFEGEAYNDFDFESDDFESETTLSG